jgi:hypothetical protein
MTWLYPAEVTPLRIRAPANALSTASNWLFNFFVVSTRLPILAAQVDRLIHRSWSPDPCSPISVGARMPFSPR